MPDLLTKHSGTSALAVNLDKELYKDFDEIFPARLLTRKMRRLLDENALLD